MTAKFLRLLAILLLLVLVQAGALASAVLARVPPWWGLLVLPVAALSWIGLRLVRAAWRRLRRWRSRGAELPPDAGLVQAWQRALQRGGAARDGAALPWFLLLGSPGAGKTTALTEAGISSPIAPIHEQSESGEGFGWWYLNRLVVLDCGDCPSERDAPSAIAARWSYHLRMLQRLRRREGVDGVVIALSARELLQADSQRLAEHARAMRACLEQLVTSLRQRFPVYVLLTQCDALYGLDDWARALPQARLDQALGYLDEIDRPGREHDFVDRAFEAMGGRLERLRWRLLAEGDAPAPGLLAFPLELQALRAPLRAFSDNGLAPHPCLEPLLVRGLFFTSGRQQAPAESRVLGSAASTAPASAGARRGLFLHDLFARVLPAERGLRLPSDAVLRRRRRARRIGLGVCLLATLAAAAALSSSFVANLQALRQLRAAALPPKLAQEPLARRVTYLLQREQAIRRFENAGERPLAHVTLLGTGWHSLVTQQKQQFVQACRGLPQAYSATPTPSVQSTTGATVLSLLRRLAVLQARSEGADLAQLELLAPARTAGGAEDALDKALWRIELARLAWAPEEKVDQPLLAVRTRLDQIGLDDPSIQWIQQTPALDGIPALRLGRLLLPGQVPAAGQSLELAPEFTAAGLTHMRALHATWRQLSARPTQVEAAWKRFLSEWRTQQLLALRGVLEPLLSSPPTWQSRTPWRAALPLLAGPDNPDWAIGVQLLQQLPAPSAGTADDTTPGAEATWVSALRCLESWRTQAEASGAESLLEPLRALSERASRGIAPSDAAGAATAVRENLRGAAAMREYLKSLSQLAQQLQLGDAQAAAVAADYQTFGSDPKTTKSLARDARQELDALDNLLERDVRAPGGPRAASSSPTVAGAQGSGALYPTDALLAAPWRSLMRYADTAAACTLQRRWQAEVLWPLQTAATRQDASRQIFGAQGTLWAFVDGPAAPFLRRDAQAYRPTLKTGMGVAFTPRFLDLLNQAARHRADQQLQIETAQRVATGRETQEKLIQAQLQQAQGQLGQARQQAQALQAANSTVTITALPTDVRPPGAPGVYLTRLSMRCASGIFDSSNINLPLQESVTWNANDCGDVRLSMHIGDIVLQRVYPGPLGFADFLADFRSGSRTFTPQDFPEQAASLRGLGVQGIVLHYRFGGADAVLRTAEALRAANGRADQAEQTLKALGERQQLLLRQAASAPAPASAPASAVWPADGAGASLGLPSRITECPDDPETPAKPT
ncbi:type VI secretion system protein [Thiomonas sp.]|uniref:type VI secretion system protein n=1 Tax=Thiomonas sp. TaxID=2047785 RepID=UPI002638F7F9|nr:type VI secretion system protein [Thiomonas sp.]